MTNMEESNYQDILIAKYDFDDESQVGKDSSGNENHAVVRGRKPPKIQNVYGRKAAVFAGGDYGTSYLQLPAGILKGCGDETGLTITTWVNLSVGTSVWERILDFGHSSDGPFIFMTRNLRASLFGGDSEIAADSNSQHDVHQWVHVALAIHGTKHGTESQAGPILYQNGEIVADGSISQTTSGLYAELRKFFASMEVVENFSNNYIGHSQFAADQDFKGCLSDFRIYKSGLSQESIIDIMCNSLEDEALLQLAKRRYLKFPTSIITENIVLPKELMGGRVQLSWKSDSPEIFSDDGKIGKVSKPSRANLTVTLSRNGKSTDNTYYLSVLPREHSPYTLKIYGDREVMDISDTLYGLFFEDINNAADGGIYAELIQNRSFEHFSYYIYNYLSGENGRSTGRNHRPLEGWWGDFSKVQVRNSGGLNEYFHCEDRETNRYFIDMHDGALLVNKGFTDTSYKPAIKVESGETYLFTVWAKSENGGTIHIRLIDEDGKSISTDTDIEVEAGGQWKKYGVEESISIIGIRNRLGQFEMRVDGEISVDMVSLVPENVWGLTAETGSKTAHANYKANPNYRLRRDMVEKLLELHPKFLRFPGGCISEGSYIWDNVYDWKDSIGPVEVRKENYNVWGYMMTMGLGYMEYFQLAEDLNAAPLPVMACGVLCQARSDYANPAGGRLREKYIRNFTDLIDFAISTDFEHNKWAKVRRDMGHEAPFDLHLLGVGNENWGEEFYANFQIFKRDIDAHMEKYYPGYDLKIISTVGAQADDKAYQEGWKFLSGNMPGEADIQFTDGEVSEEEHIRWYEYQPHYMETIADEHFYRSNMYLLYNEDRYNYYYRAFDENGNIDDSRSSKVFVGEYASSDKNTLAGAVAEAAIMTGFEKNSDVVRLAAYAPLFNKVLNDRQYRWTPDLIWFDNEKVWCTPNYYVQQMFAKYLGTRLLDTSFTRYVMGQKEEMKPHGGIFLASGNGEIHIRTVKVVDNETGETVTEVDFRKGMPEGPKWQLLPGTAEDGVAFDSEEGLILKATQEGWNGLWYEDWYLSGYRMTVEAVKVSGVDGFRIGMDAKQVSGDFKSYLEYAVGYSGKSTGIKVFKRGVEGYRLGDFSNSTCAGNLRACQYEGVEIGKPYTIEIEHGGRNGHTLQCSYTDGEWRSLVVGAKLDYYNFNFYTSATKDDEHIYVKVVNAEDIDKRIRIDLEGVEVRDTGKLITLAGTEENLNTPNVNTKDAERIVPKETAIALDWERNAVWMKVRANSVNVIVLDIK